MKGESGCLNRSPRNSRPLRTSFFGILAKLFSRRDLSRPPPPQYGPSVALLSLTIARSNDEKRGEVTSMWKSILGSLVVMGLVLVGLPTSVVQAGTPAALAQYQQAVTRLMRWNGEVFPSDRAILDGKKVELGLTDEEASDIEDQIRANPPPDVFGRIHGNLET
jgi:hypothetical protein